MLLFTFVYLPLAVVRVVEMSTTLHAVETTGAVVTGAGVSAVTGAGVSDVT